MNEGNQKSFSALRDTVRRIRKRNQQLLKRIDRKGDVWNIDGHTAQTNDKYDNSYEATFADFFIYRYSTMFGNIPQDIRENMPMPSYLDWQSLPKNFDELISKRKNSGRSTIIADFFGGGYFLQNWEDVDAMIAMRYEDIDEKLIERQSRCVNRSEEIRFFVRNSNRLNPLQLLQHYTKLSEADNRHVITGDIFSNDAYRKLKDILQSLDLVGEQKIDVAVDRPMGGFYENNLLPKKDNPVERKTMHEDAAKYFFMQLDRIYRLVSSDSGMIFTEIPDIKAHKAVEKLVAKLRETRGIKVMVTVSTAEFSINRGRIGLVILKESSAPERLPYDI